MHHVHKNPNFEKCFDVMISEPEELQVLSSLNTTTNSLSLELKGGNGYYININGKTQYTEESQIELEMNDGLSDLKVTTDLDCQGSFETSFNIGAEVIAYPNPITDGLLRLSLPDTKSNESVINLFGYDGSLD